MAILIRGTPTAPRKEWPNKAIALIIAVPSLLLSTLDPNPPLPQGKQSFPVQVHQKRDLVTETSRGMPSTLQTPRKRIRGPLFQEVKVRPEVKVYPNVGSPLPLLRLIPDLPVVPSLHLAAYRFPSLPADTSQGTPLSLPVAAVAAAPSTDITRGPLLQQAKTPPEVKADTSGESPLPLIAAIAPPIVPTLHLAPLRYPWLPGDTSESPAKAQFGDSAAPFPVPPSIAPFRPSLSADTSQGQPPTLKDVAPFAPVAHVAPLFLHNRALRDTSRGTPKALTEDATAPFALPIHVAPMRYQGLPADTTQEMQSGLREIAPPIVPPQNVGPQRYPALTADIARSVPKTLTADATAPLDVPVHIGPLRYPGLPADASQGIPAALLVIAPPITPATPLVPQWYRALPADTSQGVPKTLTADATPPFALPAHLAPQRYPRLLSDTTQGVPKALTADEIAPFSVPPHVAVERYRTTPPDIWLGQPVSLKVAPFIAVAHVSPPRYPSLLGDTSQSQPASLAFVAAPFVPSQHCAPLRFPWLSPNTSQGVPKVAFGDAIAPFVPAPYYAPLRYPSLPASTSQGIAKPQFYDSSAPFIASAHVVPQRYPSLPADTSQAQPATLKAIAPFTPSLHLSPPQRPTWLPGDTTQGVPKAAFGDAIAPFALPVHFGPLRFPGLPASTSQGIPSGLRVPPFVPPPHAVPLRYPGLPADTSQAVPKTLTEDKQLPFFVVEGLYAPTLNSVRQWVPADGTQGLPPGLRVLAAPFVPASHLSPPRYPWALSDTARGMAKVVFSDSIIFRRTLSTLGTRIGSRQVHKS